MNRYNQYTCLINQEHEYTNLAAEFLPRREMEANNRIGVGLIDERSFTRASFSFLLKENAREFVVFPFAEPGELLHRHSATGEDLGLIVLNVGTADLDERFHENIHQLRHALPGAPLVILSDRKDVSLVMDAFHWGARGFLPTSLDAAVIIQVLRLVQAGGTFMPADVLLAALEAQLPGTDGGLASDLKSAHREIFTPRQWEVIQLLLRGKSNKVIAYELRMQESTVKVHLQHIMKKLKATNRTQAALLAYRTVQCLAGRTK